MVGALSASISDVYQSSAFLYTKPFITLGYWIMSRVKYIESARPPGPLLEGLRRNGWNISARQNINSKESP